MYLVIELSLGEYGNPVNMLIERVNEQNQNDFSIIS